MSLACIFPGQGAQKVGMCKELYQNSAVAKAAFDEVDSTLNLKLSEIIFEGPNDRLLLTENTQPALMVCSIALLRVLETKLHLKLSNFCSYVAGHSLGEFTALVASGVLSLSDCAKLLKIRGRAMQEAVPFGKGAMFALLGANIEVSKQIALEASAYGTCQVANDNAPTQQVLSGTHDAIEKAIEIAVSKNYKAIKLNVSGPFHSTLMSPAKETLEAALNKITLQEPKVPIISNVSAAVTQTNEIKQTLLKQITNTVRWSESIQTLKELGTRTILEVGPGNIYTNLTKRIDNTITALSLNDVNSINIFVEQYPLKTI